MKPTNSPEDREAMRDEALLKEVNRHVTIPRKTLEYFDSDFLQSARIDGFRAGSDWQYEQDKLEIENLKMVCRRLANAKSLESRDRIATECLELYLGTILRNGHE